jgi:hypothetical protein
VSSPVLSTKGWPVAGHSALSLKPVVSQTIYSPELAHLSFAITSTVTGRPTSSMSCGILIGWLAGQLPVDRKVEGPAVGYATWSLWLGLSRFLPSQQLVKCQHRHPHRNVKSDNLRGIQDIGPDTAGARLSREALKVTTSIGAGSCVVSAKVLGRKATEAALRLVERLSALHIADEHAEALSTVLVQTRFDTTQGERRSRDGVQA